jgi:hypothetical protein
MTLYDVLKIIGSIAVSFGGGAVILVALSGWLGNLWARRILQNEGTLLQGQIEELHLELGLRKSSYDHYLVLILNYYSIFYRHYRLCQRTTAADAYWLDRCSSNLYKRRVFKQLDQFLKTWAEQEGKIRLLLPSTLLSIHNEAIDRFNTFKQTATTSRKETLSQDRPQKMLLRQWMKSKRKWGLSFENSFALRSYSNERATF